MSRKKQKIIMKGRSSFFSIFIIIIPFILLIYQIIAYNQVDFIAPSIFIVSLLVYYYFYKVKVIITESRFYIFIGKKPLTSISLLHDIQSINVYQSKIGVVFNFGTLVIKDTANTYHKCYLLHNPSIIYKEIVNQHNHLASSINPNYKMNEIDFNVQTNKSENLTDTGKEVDKV